MLHFAVCAYVLDRWKYTIHSNVMYTNTCIYSNHLQLYGSSSFPPCIYGLCLSLFPGEHGSASASVSPASPVNVQQLEALMRIHVMMAQLEDRGAKNYQTHCLRALHYCSLIWKVGLSAQQ